MRPVLLTLTMCLAPLSSHAADDWATSFPADRVASYLPQAGKQVAVAPAGERSAEVVAAAAALHRALAGSAKATVETCAHSDDLDDLLVVKHCTVTADVFFVIRVFPAAEGPPAAVVTLHSSKGASFAAFSTPRGLPVDAQTTSASSVGVSQEARESVLSVVERKKEPEAGVAASGPSASSPLEAGALRRWQFALAPVLPSLGGFVVTMGTSLRASVEIAGGFGVTASLGINWLRLPGEFSVDLPSNDLLATDASGTLGVQYAPTLGRLRPLVRLGLLLVGGSHMLKPQTVNGPATFAATGLRAGLAASLGASFEITPAFRVVLELQYQLVPSDISSVAGCDETDLRALDTALRSGQDPSNATVKSGCSKPRFTGVDENGFRRSNDVPLALNLVRGSSGAIAHRIAPMLGFELAF